MSDKKAKAKTGSECRFLIPSQCSHTKSKEVSPGLVWDLAWPSYHHGTELITPPTLCPGSPTLRASTSPGCAVGITAVFTLKACEE